MHRLKLEQEKQLIDYFRDNPSLWNNKDKEYNNRALRVQKLDTIARLLSLTRKDVYEKYRNLRTTFFREFKRVKSSNENGSAEKYVSRWRHYQNMLFLTKENFNDINSVSVLNEDSTSQQHAGASGGALGNGNEIEFVDASHLQSGAIKIVPINRRHNVNSHNEIESMQTEDAIFIQSIDSNPNAAAAAAALFSNSAVTNCNRLIATNTLLNSSTSKSFASLNSSSSSSSSQLTPSSGSAIYPNNIRPKTETTDSSPTVVIKGIRPISLASSFPVGPNVVKGITSLSQPTLSTITTNSPNLVQALHNQSITNHSTPIATAHKSSLYLLPASNSTSPTSATPLDGKRVHQVGSTANTGLIITNGPSGAIIGTQANCSNSNNTSAASSFTNSTGALSLNGAMDVREVIKNVVQEAIVDYEDEEMAFCRSLAASLRTLDRSKKDVAKLELQQVIVRYTNPSYCKSNLNMSTSLEEEQGDVQRNECNAINTASSSNTNGHGKSTRKQKSTSNAVSTIMTVMSITAANTSKPNTGIKLSEKSAKSECESDPSKT